MSTHQLKRNNVLSAAMFALFVLVVGGCEKDNPVEAGITDANLFPLAQGRLWVFTAYELDTTNSQKIASTVHREASYVQGTATFGGKSAFRLIDSLYMPSGAIEEVDTSYVAVENGDLYQWESDVNMWFKVFKKSAKLEEEYEVATYQENFGGITVSIVIKGKIFAKESVTAPIGTVQAYKVEIKATGSALGQQFTSTQYLYFADGYGPVRFYTPVQQESGSGQKMEGSESLLVSKNF